MAALQAQHAWRVGAGGYAVRTDGRRTIYLQKEVMAAPRGIAVLFLNGDRLDVRRSNLVLGTRSDSARRRRTRSASGYRGVWREKTTGQWIAVIHDPRTGRSVTLDRFETREAAARCRDAFARHLQGRSVKLNFPDEDIAPDTYAAFFRLGFHDRELRNSEGAALPDTPSGTTIDMVLSEV